MLLALLVDRAVLLSPDFVLLTRLLAAFVACLFVMIWARIYFSPKERAWRKWKRESRRRHG